jgi:hypothetical protein
MFAILTQNPPVLNPGRGRTDGGDMEWHEETLEQSTTSLRCFEKSYVKPDRIPIRMKHAFDRGPCEATEPLAPERQEIGNFALNLRVNITAEPGLSIVESYRLKGAQ